MPRLPQLCLLLLLLLIGYLACAGAWLLWAPLVPERPISITIEAGRNLQQVAQELQHKKVIRSSLALKLLARWQGQGQFIQAGHYRFTEAADLPRILERLLAGDVEKVSLTIPEGFTLAQIFERIEARGYGSKTRLWRLAQDQQFRSELKIDADSLEGYLFPETYLFAPGIAEQELLRMMVAEFRRQVDDSLLQAARKQNLDRHQLVTLASIIEKETAQVEEMPLISSVLHNRLARNIPLQADPTVIYGIGGDFDGNLTRAHLQAATPYNTYRFRGLPPGPIASPGLAALQAAARPASTDYLYFVARGDGSHQFSRTLQEHNAAVRKYQLRN